MQIADDQIQEPAAPGAERKQEGIVVNQHAAGGGRRSLGYSRDLQETLETSPIIEPTPGRDDHLRRGCHDRLRCQGYEPIDTRPRSDVLGADRSKQPLEHGVVAKQQDLILGSDIDDGDAWSRHRVGPSGQSPR